MPIRYIDQSWLLGQPISAFPAYTPAFQAYVPRIAYDHQMQGSLIKDYNPADTISFEWDILNAGNIADNVTVSVEYFNDAPEGSNQWEVIFADPPVSIPPGGLTLSGSWGFNLLQFERNANILHRIIAEDAGGPIPNGVHEFYITVAPPSVSPGLTFNSHEFFEDTTLGGFCTLPLSEGGSLCGRWNGSMTNNTAQTRWFRKMRTEETSINTPNIFTRTGSTRTVNPGTTHNHNQTFSNGSEWMQGEMWLEELDAFGGNVIAEYDRKPYFVQKTSEPPPPAPNIQPALAPEYSDVNDNFAVLTNSVPEGHTILVFWDVVNNGGASGHIRLRVTATNLDTENQFFYENDTTVAAGASDGIGVQVIPSAGAWIAGDFLNLAVSLEYFDTAEVIATDTATFSVFSQVAMDVAEDDSAFWLGQNGYTIPESSPQATGGGSLTYAGQPPNMPSATWNQINASGDGVYHYIQWFAWLPGDDPASDITKPVTMVYSTTVRLAVPLFVQDLFILANWGLSY